MKWKMYEQVVTVKPEKEDWYMVAYWDGENGYVQPAYWDGEKWCVDETGGALWPHTKVVAWTNYPVFFESSQTNVG